MDWGEFNRQLAREPGLYNDYRYQSIPLETQPPTYVNVFVRRDLPPLTAGEPASGGG